MMMASDQKFEQLVASSSTEEEVGNVQQISPDVDQQRDGSGEAEGGEKENEISRAFVSRRYGSVIPLSSLVSRAKGSLIYPRPSVKISSTSSSSFSSPPSAPTASSAVLTVASSESLQSRSGGIFMLICGT